jgi:hypothetical protein
VGVRSDGADDTKPAGEYTFFYVKRNVNHELEAFFLHKENHISSLDGRVC